ncbi:MAG: endopeptidase La [Chloroflexota bacterium]|nr:endopeptidase La [Chloroflexota bacterium]
MVSLSQQEENAPETPAIPEELLILPTGEAVLYPSMVVPLSTQEEATVKIIDEAMAGDKFLALIAYRPGEEQQFYQVGTAAIIARMLKMPDGTTNALIQGLQRIRLKKITQTEPFLKCRVELLEEENAEQTTELEAMMRNLVALFEKVVSLAPNLPPELSMVAANMTQAGGLADFAAAHINIAHEQRQDVLETLDVVERVKKVTGMVNREIEILELGTKIQSQMKEEMDKKQREFYLREQLKAIQKELGETDERAVELNELRDRIAEAKLPPEAQKEAERELERLERMPPAAAEYSVARTYLDWLTSLPWATSTEDKTDIEEARRVLDEDHYDLDKVKERILEYLAVRQLNPDMKGPILCFVGPPGTGKTSVGQSIARALGRKFVRLSLGGIRDEAEIRGHRRTYVGALPGRIIQSIHRAGSNNPVFMLDEVDKVGMDFRGDPTAALLEVLDPEQNHAFSDHYLDVPFDLSQVVFITTANVIDPIPPALRDRMEVLELPGYTELEKLSIARPYLIPRQLKENGLTEKNVEFTDPAILTIIRDYTREAGVRNLERQIGTICRKVAMKVASGARRKVNITPRKLHDYLGAPTYRYEVAERGDEVGVATGLAWTPVGGEILFIEASLVPGRGNLILTGKLGDVMQESGRAALTFARGYESRAPGRRKARTDGRSFFDNHDVHIHIPAGAIPKDGPSAGVTIAAALVSAVTGRPVRKDVAMTGEITLRGKVLPVGGVRDKVLAAHRAGIRKVALPRENIEKDLEEVPQQVKDEVEFIPVRRIADVLKAVLK